MRAVAALLLASVALAACGRDEPEPRPTPKATVSAPRTLVSAELDFAELGARIEGPQGTEVETVLSAGGRELGTMTSYVACPKDMAECVPDALPLGTIYTYVHSITLAEADPDADAMAAESGPEVLETPPTLFRTRERALGFANAVGYDRAQAEAALGAADALSITSDAGRIIWRVTEGEGWKPGATITFWWQSTQPPAGPAKGYVVEIAGNQALATGPLPAAETKPAKPSPAR